MAAKLHLHKGTRKVLYFDTLSWSGWMGDGLPALSLSASSITEERADKREPLPLIDSAHLTATRTRVNQRNRDRTRSLFEGYRA